ncbi:SH3 domain-containing protein [[Bacteroides] pectinophilus]|jgi:hypothetical protein|nr:SH3 domain-containing protein [[Bacteroides] pectinophilus]
MGRKTLLTMTGAVYIVAAITAIAVFLKNETVTMPKQEMTVQADVYIQEESSHVEDIVVSENTTDANIKVLIETDAVKNDASQQISARQTQETQHTKEQAATTAASVVAEKITDSPMLNQDYNTLYMAVGTKPTLTIRKAPDNRGSIAGWLPEGSECEVLADNIGGWVLIRYRGCTGFVYGSYLKPVNVIQ